MTFDSHKIGDNAQIERAMDAASAQSSGQHGEQMGGIGDIEATQAAHGRALQHGEDRMTNIEKMLAINNAATAEVLDIMRLGKAFFRLAGYFGSFVKWAAAIGAPLVGLWYALKGGGKP